ncbi:argininosuccinate lyase [Candidatus Peregrinibacteria bacterium]|nr:argininosuccinate lyase [Candidatus Peregrinibacteria bacterium]
MQKLWQKSSKQRFDRDVEDYTVGEDYLLDRKLVLFDVEGSLAHARMLKKIGILTTSELKKLEKGLAEIASLAHAGKFSIKKSQEDCHTAIEMFLTKKYGEAGKKIHTGRSRNDQILVTLRLYSKAKLREAQKAILGLIQALKFKSKKCRGIPMPGYTHMQRAMPSSVSMWLESFVESLEDDLLLAKAVAKIIDQNPLGSAAGFGENILGLDRKFTSRLLGFARVQKNPMYCALSRGKFEWMVLQALSQIMFDLGKFASDLLLFTTKEFDFFSLPDAFRTGSSIMPQKKNYDVLELMRGNVGIFTGFQYQIQEVIKNLPSGYNRDFQLTKEPYLKALRLFLGTAKIATSVAVNLVAREKSLRAACSKELYATDEVYRLVKKGLSFREAYRKIGLEF